MTSGANPDDEQRLADYAAALGDALAATVGPWVERIISERCVETHGLLTGQARSLAGRAADDAHAAVVPRAVALLATDIDEQRSNPLAIVRGAVPYATEALAELGVPAVERDPFAVRAFPDDIYALSPATWSDIDPSLHEPGISWSAAKAFVFKARRRAEGRR